MEGATHFIEQYKGKVTGVITTSKPLSISMLESSLEFTKSVNVIYTVCIFKIKLKNKQHEN